MKERKEKVLAFMREKAYKPLNFSELMGAMDVLTDEIGTYNVVLDELIEEGRIIKTKKGKYGFPEKMNLVSGRIRASERGYAFLITEDLSLGDIFVPPDCLNGSMDGDLAMVKIIKAKSAQRKAEGEVIRILKRVNDTIVGTFEKSRHFSFVIPENPRFKGDIFISKGDAGSAKDGQKVVVQITEWPTAHRNAEGKVIEILGDKDSPEADMKAIMRAYKLNESFPDKVIRSLELIPEEVSADLVSKRLDLRDLKMVTIDGEDAKDLDDAVSIEKTEKGFKLGVHIADVAHYVKENSPLDKEALKRGTSVYLVDRVIPMLPRKLSNGICSLNPKVDRLAMSVFMEIDSTGKVFNHEFYESVIRTNERMTYTNVYKILEEQDAALIARYGDLVEDFKTMKELALILRKKRMDRGAIDFNFQESKVLIDEKGIPIDIKRVEITIANQIIEEFMLICNETVSEHFFWEEIPFIYRIHENPDVEKIESFAEFAFNLGYVLKGANNVHPKALSSLLESVRGKKEERLISTVMLRSLKKAHYTSYNDIHFGLSAKYYSHFTSPIRRYPDLMIHRIMKEYLHGRMNVEREAELNEKLPEVTNHCSSTERSAEEAERETVDLKKVEYMIPRLGEAFEGIISNVTNFGMFVELENTIEGLVKLSSMEDDYYIYDDKHHILVGERTRKVYRIGDMIRVMLIRANRADRKIEFIIEPQE